MARIVGHELVRGYDGDLGDDRVLEFTEEYAVQTDGPLDSDLPIRRHPRTPKNRRSHAHIPLARVLSVRVKTKDHINWRVKVDYSTEIGEPEAKNPLARPALVSMRSGRVRALTRRDGQGRALLNTAFDPFGPQEIERPIKIFSVKKNIPAEYPEWLEELDWAVNDGDILFADRTRKRHTLLVDGMTIGDPDAERDATTGQEFPFRPLDLDIAWDPRRWDRILLNEGFNELAEVTLFDENGRVERRVKEKRRIRLDDGEAPAKALLLNGKGRPFRGDDGNLLQPAGAVDPDGARLVDNGQQFTEEVTADEDTLIAIRWLPQTEAPFSILPLE